MTTVASPSSPLQRSPNTSSTDSYMKSFLPTSMPTSVQRQTPPKAAHLRDIQLPTNTHLRQHHRTDSHRNTNNIISQNTHRTRFAAFCAQKRGATLHSNDAIHAPRFPPSHRTAIDSMNESFLSRFVLAHHHTNQFLFVICHPTWWSVILP